MFGKLKYKIILVLCLAAMMLSGCGEYENKTIEYRNGAYNFDNKNKIIELPSGYELNQLHPYEAVETEDGVDIIFHFNVEGGN